MDQISSSKFIDKNLELEPFIISTDQKLVYILSPVDNFNFSFDIRVIKPSVSTINFIVLADASKVVNCKINTSIYTSNASLEVKSILFASEFSKISMEINSFVDKNTTNNFVSQSINGLLLTQTAKIIGSPNLQINTLDVKAKHSLKIGSLDKEELFYLMSKGFSLLETKKIIIDSYLQELLSFLSEKEKNYYLNFIVEKLFNYGY